MLTHQEKLDISNALQMWSNYIQTQDVILSAQDAEKMGKKVRALNTDQMKKIIELEELKQKVLNLPTSK